MCMKTAHLGVIFSLHARSAYMCWSYFQETIPGLQQLVTRWGAMELVYVVRHEDYGTIAVGTFDAFGRME